MRDHIRVTLLSFRDLVATAVPFILLAVGLLALAYWLLDPTPPRHVVLATGQDQGAYAAMGKRYAQILQENGIEVRLRKTAGAAENIALLREPGGDVDIAFVQGGAEEAPAADGGGGRAPRRPRRCARVRVRPGVAARADAAADARHPPVRFRPGRGVRASLAVAEPGDAAARRGRPRRRHSAERCAPGRADRDAGGAPANPPCPDPAVRARRAAGTRQRRLVPEEGRLPERAQHRAAARQGSAALLYQRPAGAAALPAVLARQPGRPDVARAGDDRRRADPAVAHAAAALHLPRPLAHLPLVPAAARSRERDRQTPERRAAARARRDRAPRRAHQRAAELHRRALFAAHPHSHGRRAARRSGARAGERAMSSATRPRVLVVGCGFGGIEAVRALSKAPVEITLVDRTNHHLFQPLLYQVATAGLSAPAVSAPIRHALRREMERGNLTILKAEVRTIDVAARTVSLDGGETIAWDHLIVAAGATHGYFGHDEWQRHAPGLKTLADAFDIRARVIGAFESAERSTVEAERHAWLSFVVIGGGPTGVEMAGTMSEIAQHTLAREFRRIDPKQTRVILLEGSPRILGTFVAKQSERARTQLERLGVDVRTESKVTAIDAEGVSYDSAKSRGSERIEARTVIWAAGVAGSPLGAELARSGAAL